jgi:nitroreductase
MADDPDGLGRVRTGNMEHAANSCLVQIDPGVEAALASRRSVRGFTGEPVPLEVVRHILALASRAPSMTNSQPWRVHVLTGAPLAALKSACREAHRTGEHWDAEYDYYPAEWTSPYLERRRQIGWALYGLLGIAKGDRAASHRQHGRNYDFFDAPIGMILTTTRVMRTGSYIDLGMFLQNAAIAARGYGLDTCPQAAFAFMHPIIRAQLDLADEEIVVCGMALGHADPAEPANALRTVRESVDEFATFHHG